jgi:hypothetical protein
MRSRGGAGAGRGASTPFTSLCGAQPDFSKSLPSLPMPAPPPPPRGTRGGLGASTTTAATTTTTTSHSSTLEAPTSRGGAPPLTDEHLRASTADGLRGTRLGDPLLLGPSASAPQLHQRRPLTATSLLAPVASAAGLRGLARAPPGRLMANPTALPPTVGTMSQFAYAKDRARALNLESALSRQRPPDATMLACLSETYCAHAPLSAATTTTGTGTGGTTTNRRGGATPGGGGGAAVQRQRVQSRTLASQAAASGRAESSHLALWSSCSGDAAEEVIDALAPSSLSTATTLSTAAAPAKLSDDLVDAEARPALLEQLSSSLSLVLQDHDAKSQAVKLTRFD